MPDEATTVPATTPTPAPAASPTAAQPPPAAPAPTVSPPTPPVTPAPATPAQPDLTTDQRIIMTDGSGKDIEVTLGDMQASYIEKISADPKKQAAFDTYEKAVAGDAEAQRKLFEEAMPAKPDAALTADQRVAALQDQMQKLQQQLSATTPTVENVKRAQEINALQSVITQHATDVPYLAKHPNGAQRVHAKIRDIAEAAAAMGQDLANHPRNREIIAGAFKMVNQELQADATVFQGFTPGAAPPATPQPTLVNDQGTREKTADHIPARIQFTDQGTIAVPQQEQVTANAALTSPTIPSVPQAVPTGGMPGETAGIPVQTGPYGPDQMQQRMAARLTEIATQ